MLFSPLTQFGAATAAAVIGRMVHRVVDSADSFGQFLASPSGAPAGAQPGNPPPREVLTSSGLRKKTRYGNSGSNCRSFSAKRACPLRSAWNCRPTARAVSGSSATIRTGPRIEQAINSDPQLLATFQYLAATDALRVASERHRELTEQYLGDPVMGGGDPARFAHADEQAFTLRMNGDELAFVTQEAARK